MEFYAFLLWFEEVDELKLPGHYVNNKFFQLLYLIHFIVLFTLDYYCLWK